MVQAPVINVGFGRALVRVVLTFGIDPLRVEIRRSRLVGDLF